MYSQCPDTPEVDTRMALCRQMTLECYDCDRTILADPAKMEQIFLEAAGKSGATVISSHFHAFVPQGISGVVIISESHFAVHAWPEYDYAAVDIFTCGDSIDFDTAADTIRGGLGSARTIVSSLMNRGIVNNQGVERMMTVCEDPDNSYSLSWKKRYDRTQAYGISVSVDLYECSAQDCEEAVTALTARLEENCGLVQDGRLNSFSSDNITELRVNLQKGQFSCHFNRECRSAYVDIFNAGYFEPRLAAEAALECFSGKNYRMQIAIRQ